MGWACSVCGTPYKLSPLAYEAAKACCADKPQPKPPPEDYAAEMVAVEQAKKVPLEDYRGTWMYAEGVYFERETLGDVQRDRRERNEDPLAYAWACEPEEADFNLGEALEAYVEAKHDKGLVDEIDQSLLDAAQLLVDEALAEVVSQRVRHDLVVVLPEAEAVAPRKAAR